MWQPIQQADQLVELFERSNFDLKKMYDLALAKTEVDLAKDVAAFASAYGGTVLVGAEEQGGRLVGLSGVADVPRLVTALSTAVKQRCSPCPLYAEAPITLAAVDCARLLPAAESVPAGVTLLAINVEPDPRGPIGVRPLTDKGNVIRQVYEFPIRVGNSTDWLDPEDLAMWMNSHERRIALKLRQAGAPARVRIFHMVGEQNTVRREREFELAAVDERRTVAVLRQFAPDPPDEAHVPFSFILDAWQEPQDGMWQLAIQGHVFPGNATSRVPFRFRPLMTR